MLFKIFRCGCGRRLDDHRSLYSNSSTNLKNENKKKNKILNKNDQESNVWKIQSCTEIFPTNAFGTIEFQGADMYTGKAEVIKKNFFEFSNFFFNKVHSIIFRYKTSKHNQIIKELLAVRAP